MPKLVSTLAVASAAAVGLYIPTFGFLGPLGACERIAATASAAPSPTCAGDLRECLRLSAKTGIYGARYVEADDVAKCVEAFNACIHGSSGNPNPPSSTSARDRGKSLPTHFAITTSYGVVSDCRADGDAVTCTESVEGVGYGVESDTSTITGTLSGLTITGTGTSRRVGHVETDPSCGYIEDHSFPATYRFSPDGTVTISHGPSQWKITHTGSCSYLDPDTGSSQSTEYTGTWSAIP